MAIGASQHGLSQVATQTGEPETSPENEGSELAMAAVRGRTYTEGFLDMLSKHRKAWHKRYFRIQDDAKKQSRLVKFSSEHKPVKGELPKTAYKCSEIVVAAVCADLHEAPYCFFVVLKSGQETLYFSANSLESRQHWLERLHQQAMRSRNRDPVRGLPLANALWLLDRKGEVSFSAWCCHEGQQQQGEVLAVSSPAMRSLAPIAGGQMVWGLSREGVCHVLQTTALYGFLAVDSMVESQRYIPMLGVSHLHMHEKLT